MEKYNMNEINEMLKEATKQQRPNYENIGKGIMYGCFGLAILIATHNAVASHSKEED